MLRAAMIAERCIEGMGARPAKNQEGQCLSRNATPWGGLGVGDEEKRQQRFLGAGVRGCAGQLQRVPRSLCRRANPQRLGAGQIAGARRSSSPGVQASPPTL